MYDDASKYGLQCLALKWEFLVETLFKALNISNVNHVLFQYYTKLEMSEEFEYGKGASSNLEGTTSAHPG